MQRECSNCSKECASKCGKCKLAYYCSRECQVAHFEEHHNTLCKGVTSCLKWIAKEERKLRKEEPGIFGDGADGGWSGVGNFWNIFESRDYMRARQKYFLLLEKIGTTPAIEEALKQGRDMLRLCRGDNLGIRFLMPAMFLLFRSYDGMQECYDFVKWWMTGDPDGHYDWGNPSLPYLNIHGADMCEPVWKEALGKFADVYFCVGLTVIKMRLHHDVLTALRANDALLGATVVVTSPVQKLRGHEAVLRNIAAFLCPTYACLQNRPLGELRRLETSLSEQVEALLTAVEGRNPRTWKALVNPGKALRAPIPPGVSMGSAEEIICLVRSFTHVFNQDCADARMLRKRLTDRVGEAPTYDMTSMFYR